MAPGHETQVASRQPVLEPLRPARLGVTGSASNSRRWLMIFE